jgi:hypothetical protein
MLLEHDVRQLRLFLQKKFGRQGPML